MRHQAFCTMENCCGILPARRQMNAQSWALLSTTSQPTSLPARGSHLLTRPRSLAPSSRPTRRPNCLATCWCDLHHPLGSSGLVNQRSRSTAGCVSANRLRRQCAANAIYARMVGPVVPRDITDEGRITLPAQSITISSLGRPSGLSGCEKVAIVPLLPPA